MAIAKMKKLTAIGLANKLPKFMRSLSDIGVVEITNLPEDSKHPFLEYMVREKTPEEFSNLSENQNEIEKAIGLLSFYCAIKKSAFTPKTVLTKKEFDLLNLKMADALQTTRDVLSLEAQIQKKKVEIGKLRAQMISLSPWKNLDVPLSFTGTTNTIFNTYTFASSVDIIKVKQIVIDSETGAVLDLVSSDTDAHYTVLLCHKDNFAEVTEMIRDFEPIRQQFKGIEGTPQNAVKSLKTDLLQLENDIEELKLNVIKLGNYVDLLEQTLDFIQSRKNTLEAHESVFSTENTFALTGWVPLKKEEKIKKLLDKFDCAFELTEPEDASQVPIVLENNAFLKPFESIVELYGLPNYDGIDASGPISIFFLVLFGMMLGDVGYGLLLVLGCGIGLKLLRPKGFMKNLLTLLLYCGISTAVFGFIFGSIFSDLIPVLVKMITGNTIEWPTLINPMTQSIPLLIISMGLGVVQIFFGILLKGIILIKNKKYLDAVFDSIILLIMLSGLLLLIPGGTVAEIGKYMAISGAIGIVLTNGRDAKTIGGKFAAGIYALYNNVSGSFSDILSYSRILALCLAGGVIGSVVNQMGALPGASFFGFIAFTLIFLLGHTMNIALSALGAFVHTARLNYVEFFGKFYESGGKAFKPLCMNPQYIEINKIEEEI